ncbi:MAG: adenylyltransferase/cytidyltransferase family protein [Pseudanabaenaceae cyanobacterium]
MVIFELQDLQRAIDHQPDQWRPLVLTNGCFDLLHVGHVRYLQTASRLGKALVVGINSDRSVQALKGNHRPIIPQAQRAEVVSALRGVAGVVIFEELTAEHLIATLQPDIYVKGGDYQPETLPEMTLLTKLRIKLELIKVEVPTSTSGIVTKIKQSTH